MWDAPSKSVRIIFSATEARSMDIRNIAKEETVSQKTQNCLRHSLCQTNRISRVGVKVTQSVNGRQALVGERKGHSEQNKEAILGKEP